MQSAAYACAKPEAVLSWPCGGEDMRNKKIAGALLRLERLRQGLMLKQVCQGICVTSYLSKIEHGSADADEEILAALFARLGVQYTQDEAVLAPLREQLAAYHEQYLYGMDKDETYRALMAQDMLLTYSPLCADWLIVRGLEHDKVLEHLDALADCLTDQQRAWRNMLQAWEDVNAPQSLELAKSAAAVLGNSGALMDVCILALYQNEYTLIHRMENQLTHLALTEGNTYILGCYYDFKGMAYSCLDQDELMMDCYHRAIHLLQGTRWTDRLSNIYYNIGATYVIMGRYDQALRYLTRAEGPGIWMLAVRHKQALAYIRMGDVEKGREYLALLKKEIEGEKNPAEGVQLWYQEAEAECREGFLDDPAYLALMDRLLAAFRKEAHFGYIYAFREVYVKACTRQRQYKKALEFEQLISSAMQK